MQETILSLKEEFSTGRQILWPGRQVLCQHLCADGSIIPKRRQVGRRRTRTCLPCQLTCEPLTGWHPQHVALNQSAAAMRGEGKVSEIGLRHPGGCRPHVGERSATSISAIWDEIYNSNSQGRQLFSRRCGVLSSGWGGSIHTKQRFNR